MAELITLNEFNTYMNDYETSTTIDQLKSNCLKSAINIVEGYLKYSLDETTRTEAFTNNYKDFIITTEYPVSITSLSLNNISIPIDDIILKKYYITVKKYYDYLGVLVDIVYKSGWTALTLPASIKMVVLEIATLLFMQTNKNIGITGLMGADNLSRTFVNYTNYDKYLIKLNNHKRL